MVKVVTDSTSDLTHEIVSELGITVVPLYVHFGNQTYRDTVDITTEDFYRRLAESKVLPTTSSPSPGDFATAYDKLAGETDEIVTITISSKLSATYNAAVEGKNLRQSQVRVEVIDSLSAIMGLGLIAISAAKAAGAGASLDEVVNTVRSSMRRVDFRIAFDTLEYLRRGGRIGTAQAFLGSMLHMNPVLTIKNGVTEGVIRLRSRAKAIDYLCGFALAFPGVEEIGIEDATTPDEVETLVQQLSSRFPKERIYRMKVSPVIGTHVGPRVLGVGVLPRAQGAKP
jgi:DegV family protein with EDD domain